MALCGRFITEWEYDQTFDHWPHTFHLWKCQHREGYTAYQITHQPPRGGYVTPSGSAHYTSLAAVLKSHPMVVAERS